MFTKSRQWILFQAACIQPTTSHAIFRLSILIIFFPLHPGLPLVPTKRKLETCIVWADPTARRQQHVHVSTSQAVLIVRVPYCTHFKAQVALLRTLLQHMRMIHWGWIEVSYRKDKACLWTSMLKVTCMLHKAPRKY